jgi:hypothetical protein
MVACFAFAIIDGLVKGKCGEGLEMAIFARGAEDSFGRMRGSFVSLTRGGTGAGRECLGFVSAEWGPSSMAPFRRLS